MPAHGCDPAVRHSKADPAVRHSKAASCRLLSSLEVALCRSKLGPSRQGLPLGLVPLGAGIAHEGIRHGVVIWDRVTPRVHPNVAAWGRTGHDYGL